LKDFTTRASGRWRCSSSLDVTDLADVPVALGVVVVGIDDDLAGRALHRNVCIGSERHGHDQHLAAERRICGRRGGRRRAELADELGKRLRPTGIRDDDVVTGAREQSRERAADVTRGDDADPRHVGPPHR
jgi:hypothetical protein